MQCFTLKRARLEDAIGNALSVDCTLADDGLGVRGSEARTPRFLQETVGTDEILHHMRMILRGQDSGPRSARPVFAYLCVLIPATVFGTKLVDLVWGHAHIPRFVQGCLLLMGSLFCGIVIALWEAETARKVKTVILVHVYSASSFYIVIEPVISAIERAVLWPNQGFNLQWMPMAMPIGVVILFLLLLAQVLAALLPMYVILLIRRIWRA